MTAPFPSSKIRAQAISISLQPGPLGEVVQKVVTLCGGNHDPVRQTLAELDVQSIERKCRGAQRIASRLHVQNFSQSNPMTVDTVSDDQVCIIEPITHGKDYPEVQASKEYSHRAAHQTVD